MRNRYDTNYRLPVTIGATLKQALEKQMQSLKVSDSGTDIGNV